MNSPTNPRSRQLEVQAEKATANRVKTPLVALGDKGLAGPPGPTAISNSVSPALGSHVTPGQQRFFRYRTTSASSDVVAADGKTVNVPRTTVLANTTFAGDAWQLQGLWVLSGEDAIYRGVKPSRNFDPLAGGWGAWALGLNWYLNRNFKVNLDYENTWFKGGGSTRLPLDRETERVLFTRFQIAY